MRIEANVVERLRSVAANDYSPPEGVAPSSFALEILPYLGSTDGELRERYVYGTLHRWIVRRVLDDQAVVRLIDILVDPQHLFRDIGAPEGDSVFLRAFSVLLLAPVVYAHRQAAFLSPQQLDVIRAKAVDYLDGERDLRGYVSSERWWAHGVAHAADVLGQLGRCEETPAEGLTSMLDAIARKALTDAAVFVFEEDARMAAAAVEILRRSELDPAWIAGWLSRLVPDARWTGELPRVHHRFLNARNVLHCLYFRGRAEKLRGPILEAITSAIASLPER